MQVGGVTCAGGPQGVTQQAARVPLCEVPVDQAHHFSAVVRERCSLPNVELTAFVDGRARARFRDRTILELDPEHVLCRALLQDGSTMDVPVVNPVGVEKYLPVLLEFSAWAMLSPTQRAQHALKHAEAERQRASLVCAQLSAIERHLKVSRGILPQRSA